MPAYDADPLQRLKITQAWAKRGVVALLLQYALIHLQTSRFADPLISFHVFGKVFPDAIDLVSPNPTITLPVSRGNSLR